MVHDTPLIAVNHLEAHALTPRLTNALAFPYCLFLASGGHTQIVAVVGVGQYVRLGTTVDDAMGEAFDKVAKMLSLPYPGGPEVERCGGGRRPEAVRLSAADARAAGCEFLAVGIEDRGSQRGQPADAARAAGCQRSLRQLSGRGAGIDRGPVERRPETVSRTVRPAARAGRRRRRRRQSAIRGALQDVAAKAQTTLIIPPPALCTDNGAMIAWAGAERLALGLIDTMDAPPRARWLLDANATAPAGYANTRAGF